MNKVGGRYDAAFEIDATRLYSGRGPNDYGQDGPAYSRDFGDTNTSRFRDYAKDISAALLQSGRMQITVQEDSMSW